MQLSISVYKGYINMASAPKITRTKPKKKKTTKIKKTSPKGKKIKKSERK